MKIRVKRGEWFFNMGIVGLYKILEKAEQTIALSDDVLEFDTSALVNFADYYFDYFIDDYKNTVHSARVELVKNTKELKGKRMKRLVDNIIDKYGKVYGEEEANKLKVELNNKRKDAETFRKELIELLERDEIKLRFAVDYIRSTLYDNFFGQMGFLNKPLANAGLDKFKEILHEQFVAPLLEDLALETWINGESEKPEFLQSGKHEVSKKFEKYKKTVGKFNSEVEAFKNFLEDTSRKCSFCGSHYCTSPKDVFDEVRFVPLGVSQETPNFFWNLEFHLPLCKLCKLVLLCAPAGAIYFSALKTIYYEQIDPEQRREGRFIFVNIESSLKDLVATNISAKYRFSKSVFEDTVLNVVKRYARMSEWILNSTFFVEFNAKYEAKQAKVKYFHIPRATAQFLQTYHRSTLGQVQDPDLREIFLSRVLFNGDLDGVIYKALRKAASRTLYPEDAWLFVKAKSLLNALKKGGIAVKRVKELIESAKEAGLTLRKRLVQRNQENKLQTLVYKLLNTSKIGDKKSFMDTLLRLYMSLETEVPKFVFEILTESTIDFETLAQGFVAGLLSDERKDSETQVLSEDVEDETEE